MTDTRSLANASRYYDKLRQRGAAACAAFIGRVEGGRSHWDTQTQLPRRLRDGLCVWLQVAESRQMLPLRDLCSLSRTCKATFAASYAQMSYYKFLRGKWSRELIHRLNIAYINSKNPITYAAREINYCAWAESMLISQYGMLPLAHLAQARADRLYALKNIIIRARWPAAFTLAVVIKGRVFHWGQFTPRDYIDAGAPPPQALAGMRAVHKGRAAVYPGRYILDLALPFRFFPAPLSPWTANWHDVALLFIAGGEPISRLANIDVDRSNNFAVKLVTSAWVECATRPACDMSGYRLLAAPADAPYEGMIARAGVHPAHEVQPSILFIAAYEVSAATHPNTRACTAADLYGL